MQILRFLRSSALVLSIALFLASGLLAAQSVQITNPADILNNLSVPFDVCSASKADIDAYGARMNNVATELANWSQMLEQIRASSMAQMKPNPNAHTEALENQRGKAQAMISPEENFASKVDALMNGDKEAYEAKLEENGNKMQHAASEGEIEALKAEYAAITVEHCQMIAPQVNALLVRWLAAEKRNASYIVAVSDLDWQIQCKQFGFTYRKEMAYEEEYRRISELVSRANSLILLGPYRE